MTPPAPPTAAPLAVYRPHGGLAFLGSLGGACVIAALLVVAPQLASASLPWPTFTDLVGRASVVAYVVIAGVGLVLAHRWARARAVCAELHTDRLVLGAGWSADTVFLDDLVAFDDASGASIRLQWRAPSGAVPVDVAVPTLDEDDRALLLDALERAGVPRAGDPQHRPTSGGAAEVPALVARGLTPRHELPGVLAVFVSALLVGGALEVSAARSFSGQSALVVGGFLAAGGLLIAAGVLRLILVVPRRGCVVLREDRLEHWPGGVIAPGAVCRVLVWDDVVAWYGRSPDHVRLVLRDGLLREAHGDPRVPTLTPEVRAAVEALLRRRGVPTLTRARPGRAGVVS